MDEEVFQKILGVLSTADGVRRDGAARSGTVEARDSIGDLHLLLFGDFFVTPSQEQQSKQTRSVILSSFPRPLGRHHSSCCPGCTSSNSECSARIGRPFFFAQPQPHPLKPSLNRRVVQDQARIQEIENFHHVLTDISYCECTARVRKFIVDAYVRGAQKSGGTAEHTQLEGNTAAPSIRY